MKKLVECVPNFSEGRRPEVIEAIVNAMAAVDGVQVLDHESDADHNRSVITLLGAPDAVVEAAFNGIVEAAKHIDMDTHAGEHPRMGATDVVPFIPIEGVTMTDCVELAHRLGKRVGTELGIPVYLYEAAATRPERENLADVRKGQYELLKEEIGHNPKRDPDYGPAAVGKAGAVIIGARAPLVAYNIYLTTDNVDIAKNIAKAIRHSSGGLRFVKGLGLLVNNKAQVSMNLTDYTRTPLHRVVEMVRREAARYGVGIESSEVVGLIPQRALIDSAQWYLQIDGFQPEQVLESRLQSGESTPSGGADAFLDSLADSNPTPGGGSAAAYAGAMAAGLVAMVARVTMGKKKYADVEARMRDIAAEADALRAQLQNAVKEDADSFTGIITALRLPKDTAAQQAARADAIEAATCHAAEVPLESARKAVRVLELAAEVAEIGNTNAVSDAGSAGGLAGACLHAATLNVKINATGVKDRDRAGKWTQALTELHTQAAQLTERLHNALRERGGIEV